MRKADPKPVPSLTFRCMESRLTDPSAHERIQAVLVVARKMVNKHYGGWKPDAREVLVSEVMIKYHRHWGRHGQPESVGAWLRPVIFTTAIDIHRKGPNDPEKVADDVTDAVLKRLFASSRGASRPAIDDDLWRRMLGLLSPSDAELINLRYFDNLTVAAIAAHLGKKAPTVTKALTTARKRLKAALERPENKSLLEELRASHPHVY